jgi:hypothetical protein
MEEILHRSHEEAYEPPAIPSEKAGGAAEEENGLRVSSEIVAVVSASVLVGGGAGMLAGVALGAINPFALGIIGVVVGTGASVPLTSLVVVRKAPRRPWWRRLFGAEQEVGLDWSIDEFREEPTPLRGRGRPARARSDRQRASKPGAGSEPRGVQEAAGRRPGGRRKRPGATRSGGSVPVYDGWRRCEVLDEVEEQEGLVERYAERSHPARWTGPTPR